MLAAELEVEGSVAVLYWIGRSGCKRAQTSTSSPSVVCTASPPKNAVSVGVGVCVSVERSIVTKASLRSVSQESRLGESNKYCECCAPCTVARRRAPLSSSPASLYVSSLALVRGLPPSSCLHLATVAYISDNNNRFRPCLQCRARFPCVNDQPLHLSAIRYGKARWHPPLLPGVQQPSMRTRTAGACGRTVEDSFPLQWAHIPFGDVYIVSFSRSEWWETPRLGRPV